MREGRRREEMRKDSVGCQADALEVRGRERGRRRGGSEGVGGKDGRILQDVR